MRDSFDIVVVGGGHNGMVAAIEFARAGAATLLVEGRERAGGCATTTELFVPSLRHNPHASCLLYTDIQIAGTTPAELGIPTFQPDAQFGIAFADGRAPAILHRPDLLAETAASLSAHSPSDAKTYVELKKRSSDLGQVLHRGLYRAPSADWFKEQRGAVQRAFGTMPGIANLGRGTARECIDRLFQAPEVRLLLYVLVAETGVPVEDVGSDVAFLGYSLWLAGRWRVPKGGMQCYSDALLAAAREIGVEVVVGSPVGRILVEHGRAIGVQTAGGREIKALRAVVAAVPVLSLFDVLLDPGEVSRTEAAEVESFRRAPSSSIGTSAFSLRQAPRYTSARHDRAIDRCLKTVVGFGSPDEALSHLADLRAGRLPRPAGVVRIQSLWDETLTPSGWHVAAADSGFPATSSMDNATWEQVRRAFPAAFLDVWSSHLSDPLEVSDAMMSLDGALGFERRMLMRMGSDQYRTGIEALYLAGPGVYPGGGVHGGCGYNAARTVLGDMQRTAGQARVGRRTNRSPSPAAPSRKRCVRR